MKKVCVIETSNDYQYLDHLASLSYILNLDFYFEKSNLFKLCKKYYPKTKAKLNSSISNSFITSNFDVLISSKFWDSTTKTVFENFYDKKMEFIFCPHGNSDKGHIDNRHMLSYETCDFVFLYGKQMIDRLKDLNILNKIKNFSLIGNFRLSYYKKFKKFYDQIIEKEIFSNLNPQHKTILYAPTWNDTENSSSFFEIFKSITNNCTHPFNLIIKPHPYLEEKNQKYFSSIQGQKFPSNILFLKDCPLIYPLLNSCDIYLGDFSSIGYDFLYFQRPMFFLDIHQRNPQNDPSLLLHNCGTQIKKENWHDIFSFIHKHEKFNFNSRQKQLYQYAFGKHQSNFDNIKKSFMNFCQLKNENIHE